MVFHCKSCAESRTYKSCSTVRLLVEFGPGIPRRDPHPEAGQSLDFRGGPVLRLRPNTEAHTVAPPHVFRAMGPAEFVSRFAKRRRVDVPLGARKGSILETWFAQFCTGGLGYVGLRV